MKYCFSNNGLAWRMVDDSYNPQDGETVFATDDPSKITAAQLSAVFSNYGVSTTAETETVDPTVLVIMEALATQESRLAALESTATTEGVSRNDSL